MAILSSYGNKKGAMQFFLQQGRKVGVNVKRFKMGGSVVGKSK
jgi:hypothetical protein